MTLPELSRVALSSYGRDAMLSLDDELLPHVRERADDPDTLKWLCESARHWALRQFVRRDLRERDWVEAEMRRFASHQVAVLIEDLSFSVTPEDKDMSDYLRSGSGYLRASSYQQGRKREKVVVGMLDHGDAHYMNVLTSASERWAGVTTVFDVIEWPKEFRLPHWPSPPTITGTPRLPNAIDVALEQSQPTR